MIDLNTLMAYTLSGLLITEALGINDSGQIVANGTINWLERAFLLTPTSVPVPAWLFLTCLGLLSVTRKKILTS